MNLLIADSGATKTDWAWLAGERPVYIRTSGLHPAYLEKEPVLAELREQLGHLNPEQIRFYGAGCYSEASAAPRSEERRVGKEGRGRWRPCRGKTERAAPG